MPGFLKRLDPFLSALIAAICLASFFPCPPQAQPWLARLTSLLITLMFFFQGAKLQRKALKDSLKNWPLQTMILLMTFGVFPLLGMGFFWFYISFLPASLTHIFPTQLWLGILFLCCLPSTVQSSIALTSIARGDVPSSICAATLSNILGIFLTPLLVGLLLGHYHHGAANHADTENGTSTILSISRELLLPFILGQISQKWFGPIVTRHRILLSFSDRGSIIIMVYAAFSVAVLQGLWHKVSLPALLCVFMLDSALLLICLSITAFLGRLAHQKTEQRISFQFCGSKKSLATGIPMANILFPHGAGIIVLPLMIYHQIQLFFCTILAQYYARRQ